MVRGICFKDKRFDNRDDNNLICPITENTIILCSNYDLMEALAKEIFNTINSAAEYNDYDCDSFDVGKAKYDLNFGLQKVIDINGQKIILSIEPAIVYRAKDIKDIWFFDWVGTGDNYREAIWPLTIFKGSKEFWAKGLDNIYKMVVAGRFGCYDGHWVKLESKTTKDVEEND